MAAPAVQKNARDLGTEIAYLARALKAPALRDSAERLAARAGRNPGTTRSTRRARPTCWTSETLTIIMRVYYYYETHWSRHVQRRRLPHLSRALHRRRRRGRRRAPRRRVRLRRAHPAGEGQGRVSGRVDGRRGDGAGLHDPSPVGRWR